MGQGACSFRVTTNLSSELLIFAGWEGGGKAMRRGPLGLGVEK